MFKKLSKIAMILVCCATVMAFFTGCNTKLKGGPSSTDYVYGNGGLAVVKGEYVYYVNSYISNKDITSAKHNKEGKIKKSGIYRTKLENGKLSYTYNQKDTEQKYSNTLTKTELVASKVAGHENTKLYIFDDKLYYASPNIEKDTSGAVKSEYLDFYSCNLDSTGNKLIFETETSSSNQDYTFMKLGNTVYLVCYDGTNLSIYNTNTKKSKVVSDSVTSVAFVEQTHYNANAHSVTDFASYVYYTHAKTDNAKGNVLAKAKITDGVEVIIDQNNQYNYEVFGATENYLVYGKTEVAETTSIQQLYQHTNSQDNRIYSNLFDKVYAIPNNGTGFNGVIGKNANGVHLVTDKITTLVEEDATVLSVTSNYIYVLESDKIYKVEIANPQTKILVSGEAKVDTTMTRYMSVASTYAFFYAEYQGQKGAVNYLTMADTSVCENNTCKTNFIGLFIGKDKPTETYED